MAPHLTGELGLAAEVGLAPDLGTLLAILGERITTEEIVTREHFEALALFDLSLILWGIEKQDPDHRASRDLYEIVELLKFGWMQPGKSKLFVSHHDPSDSYRVRFVDAFPEGSCSRKRPRLFLRENPLPLRQTEVGGISFAFHQRPKDRFLTALKIWKQIVEGKKSDPYLVLDRRAFRFETHTREEALTLIASFTRFMENNGARVEVKENRLTEERATTPAENTFSSPHYKDVKLTVLWRGVPFEVQVTTFEYAFNARYSLGEENHNLYRLGQALVFFLPRLYPDTVYRTIDKGWKDPELEKLLRRQAIQRLGWSLAA